MNFKVTIALLIILPACDDGVIPVSPSNLNSKVLGAFQSVSEPFTNGVDIETYATEQKLQLGAFELLNGLSAMDAVDFLRADGFSCTGVDCATVLTERQVLKVGLAYHRPGPLREWASTYSVTILSPFVDDPADIDARISVTQREWK